MPLNVWVVEGEGDAKTVCASNNSVGRVGREVMTHDPCFESEFVAFLLNVEDE